MSDGEFYNIEKILDRRKVNGKFEYKIKWEGYPMNQSTWEPLKNLENAIELVDEYDKYHPKIINEIKTKGEKITLLCKKRKEPNNKEIEEDEKEKVDINSNNQNNKEKGNILLEENENQNKKSTYKIDNSLKSVVTVKKQNETMIAIVDKIESNGDLIKETITTEELRLINPWILLEFYESKIKFV